MAILTVNNIKKMFGTDVIIQDITFEVQKGDRIGLVGINGSGKTTLCLPCPALSRMQRPAPLHGLRGYVHPFRLRRIHEIPV